MKTELKVLNDKVLFVIDSQEKSLPSGIILPSGVTTSKRIISGLVKKTGNGYAMMDSIDSWKKGTYWQLETNIGDYIYVSEEDCVQFIHNNINYGVVSERSILVVEVVSGT
jgi:co-chaperonin GroES (HSP10)